MMLEVLALVSLSLDAITVILYFEFPTLFGQVPRHDKTWSRFDPNPLRSPFLMIMLAGARFITFIPSLLQPHRALPATWKSVVNWLAAVNIIIIAFDITVLGTADRDSNSTLSVAGMDSTLILVATVSIICQYVYCQDQRSSIVDVESGRRLSFSRANFLPLISTARDYVPVPQQDHAHLFLSIADLQDSHTYRSKHLLLHEDILQGRHDVLHLLVRLFTYEHQHEDASAHLASIINDIKATFAENPSEVIAFVPQFVNYLSSSLSNQLCSLVQECLLQLCQTSLSCAQRLYWYINATFDNKTSSSESSETLLAFLTMVEDCGENVAKKLAGVTVSQPRSRSSSPRLTTPSTPSTIASMRPIELNPSLSHKYPLELARVPPILQCRTYFHHNIRFWHNMCELSAQLGAVHRNRRNTHLKKMLESICPQFLPSSSCYAPIQRDSHRIWSVVIEECFSFSTKNRAPIFLALEVVDYDNLDVATGDVSHQTNAIHIVDIFAKEKKPVSVRTKVSRVDRRFDRYSTGSAPAGRSRATHEAQSTSQPSIDTHTLSMLDISDPDGWKALSTKKQEHATERPEMRFSLDSYLNKPPAHSDNPSANSDGPVVDIGQWSPLPIKPSAIVPSRNGNALSGWSPTVINVPKDVNNDLLGQHGSSLLEGHYDAQCATEGIKIAPSVGPAEPFSTSNKLVSTIADNYTSSKGSPEPLVLFKERWRHKENRIRQASPVGNCRGWRLIPVIVKSQDNLRQEQMISQLIKVMHGILQESSSNGWLYPYDIIALSGDSGIVEAIPDTVSLDALRRSNVGYSTLNDFFNKFFVKCPDDYQYFAASPFGSDNCRTSLEIARDNFMKSMAGYSIVCYLLQIKDRHNGNILLDIDGHAIHIDFGFVLGHTPGGNIGFESAPFKLTAEMVEVLGGLHGALFHKYRETCVRTFMALRRQYRRILLCLEMIAQCNDDLPCFTGSVAKVVDDLNRRFRVDLCDQAAIDVVHQLIDDSLDNWRTSCYDRYQRFCSGVL